MKKQRICADLSTVYDNQTTNLNGLIIGERGCFSDDKDFKEYVIYKLIRVITTINYPYEADIGGGYCRGFKYYIPLNKANFVEEKNKLRPFESIQEFTDATGCKIGDKITMTCINLGFEDVFLFNGFRTFLDTNIISIVLGMSMYSFRELKDHYLYYKDGKWHPFGIEE